MTAPAFGSLELPYKKIAFCFAIPTIVFLGALYSVRRFLRLLFRNSNLTRMIALVGDLTLHLLPSLPNIEASAFKHSHRVVDMERHCRSNVDPRVRHRRSDSVLLGHAQFDELPL